jgi:hypothetical protein
VSAGIACQLPLTFAPSAVGSERHADAQLHLRQ